MSARLAICLFLFAAGAARAEEGGAGTLGDQIGRFFQGVELRRTPSAPADFVVRSRAGAPGETPLAAPQPRPDAKKNAARASALERELSAAAAANRARAARVKIPDAPKERRAEAKRP